MKLRSYIKALDTVPCWKVTVSQVDPLQVMYDVEDVFLVAVNRGWWRVSSTGTGIYLGTIVQQNMLNNLRGGEFQSLPLWLSIQMAG